MTTENVVVKDMLNPTANFMCLQGTKMSEMLNTIVLHYWRPIILNKRILWYVRFSMTTRVISRYRGASLMTSNIRNNMEFNSIRYEDKRTKREMEKLQVTFF